jgi:UPF0489 domain
MLNPRNLYNGFSISEAVGNNAFSFDKRKQSEIFIPPLIDGTPADLSIGQQIAFSELEDGKEKNFYGLKNFIHWQKEGREYFIFGNHNHAFFFWAYACQKGLITWGETLVHVDQHTDMRAPDKWITKKEFLNSEKVFNYTNFELNVGNFIQPAIKIGLFKSVEIIDSSVTFEKSFSGQIVLDVDMDIFSAEMDYIPKSIKIAKIRAYEKQAKFVTIATSPFFLDQQKAIQLIREVF